jgi:hypothetical protein
LILKSKPFFYFQQKTKFNVSTFFFAQKHENKSNSVKLQFGAQRP